MQLPLSLERSGVCQGHWRYTFPLCASGVLFCPSPSFVGGELLGMLLSCFSLFQGTGRGRSGSASPPGPFSSLRGTLAVLSPLGGRLRPLMSCLGVLGVSCDCPSL